MILLFLLQLKSHAAEVLGNLAKANVLALANALSETKVVQELVAMLSPIDSNREDEIREAIFALRWLSSDHNMAQQIKAVQGAELAIKEVAAGVNRAKMEAETTLKQLE